MTISISKLRLMIVEQGKKVNKINSDLRLNSLKKAHKEASAAGIGHSVEYLSDPFDYAEGLALLKVETLKLVELKNALAKANNTIILKDSTYTIAGAINLISEKRAILNTLDQALNQRPAKNRRSEMNGASYYEITEFNFDKDAIASERDQIAEEINQLESLIDQANAEAVIEI